MPVRQKKIQALLTSCFFTKKHAAKNPLKNNLRFTNFLTSIHAGHVKSNGFNIATVGRKQVFNVIAVVFFGVAENRLKVPVTARLPRTENKHETLLIEGQVSNITGLG